VPAKTEYCEAEIVIGQADRERDSTANTDVGSSSDDMMANGQRNPSLSMSLLTEARGLTFECIQNSFANQSFFLLRMESQPLISIFPAYSSQPTGGRPLGTVAVPIIAVLVLPRGEVYEAGGSSPYHQRGGHCGPL
jgi:hypothetical protein